MNHQIKIKQLEREIKKLRLLVWQDELTKLLNRRGLREIAGKWLKEIKAARQHPKRRKNAFQTLSVIFIDLDHFKRFNDQFGHLAGDRRLKKVARYLISRVRSEDLVARFGGEEFLIVLLGANEEEAGVVAEKIRQNSPASLSIGVAELKRENELDNLIAKADQALYAAKKRGRNQVFKASQV
ncbi:GGDEF domain-containing protein [Candidatus Berkelbacteria bacterium]|nr:GGDEF domain-containing protein [Candidatus Berkelbacteria bacterium]